MSIELRCTYASLPRTTRGKPLIINGDPKGENMLYCNGKSVIIRNIEEPSSVDLYTEHSHDTTVAKYSPNRFYIASADSAGKVRIWDTTNKEHILKNEYPVFAGIIKDLAWCGESKRIVIGGEGREKFGKVITYDSGNTVGDISGMSKAINACDFKPSRPFRIATASEDFTVCFLEGPPFKFKRSQKEHSNFVNALRYSPDGTIFISCGAEGKAFIYDGKTGDIKGELGSPAHKGGIYALSFKADSKQVLTVSADKTAKIWNVEEGTLDKEFILGSKVEDMQVGCLWQGDNILTVSLSGHINYLDMDKPDQPKKIIKGHNKPITALTLSEDRSEIYTGASDGQICYWNAASGDNDKFSGKPHTNQIQCMKAVDGKLVTCSMDDTLMFSDIASHTFGNQVKLPSQPQKLDAVPGGLVIVACINEIVVLRDEKIMSSQKVDFEPTSVSIHCGLTTVAIGGKTDQKVHIYTLSNDTLTEDGQFDETGHTGSITDVKYSPDGVYLAASDTNRQIHLYRHEDYKPIITSEWGFHRARVNSLDWTPDSNHLCSGGLDTNLLVLTPESKGKIIKHIGAHKLANITNVCWLDNNTMVSVAQDSNMKVWDVKF